MNEIGVLYEAVSVEKELPASEDYMFTIVNGHKNHDYKPFDTGTTHWLRPLPSHVPISVERLEALEKLVKACHDNIDYLDMDITDALTNLSTIKQ